MNRIQVDADANSERSATGEDQSLEDRDWSLALNSDNSRITSLQRANTVTYLVERISEYNTIVLIFLYIVVTAGFLALISLPLIDWIPSTDTLLGVVSLQPLGH